MERFEKSLKFGLIVGVILIALSIVTYAFRIDATNLMLSSLISFVTFGVLVAFAVIVMVKARNEYEDYSYSKGFLVGFVFLLVAYYISGLYSFVFNSYIDPEYSIQVLNQTIENLESTGMMPQEVIDQTYDQMLESLNPNKVLIKNLWISPIMAAVISAVLALFVRKKKEVE